MKVEILTPHKRSLLPQPGIEIENENPNVLEGCGCCKKLYYKL